MTRLFKTYAGAERYSIRLARQYPAKRFSLRVSHGDATRATRYYVVTFIELTRGVFEVGMD